jgi:hypothetical protein
VNFSDTIVYADESGDHNLVSINPQNPVFVLAFCVFDKREYVESVVPQWQSIKFKFWGHDSIIFHGHEIRKQHGDFNILINAKTNAAFMEAVNTTLSTTPLTIIAAAIDKSRLVQKYNDPVNPYDMALTFCMERLHRYLLERKQPGMTHVLFERRGKAEDQLLELEFRRIADGRNAIGRMPELDMRLMDKKHNSTGLQIADLVAHPIGRHVINAAQSNRAFDIVKSKLRSSHNGRYIGYGLKVFP